MQHRIKTKIEQESAIVLHDLLFQKGETVEILITIRRSKPPVQSNKYPLRDKPEKLIGPFYLTKLLKTMGAYCRDCIGQTRMDSVGLWGFAATSGLPLECCN